MLRYSLGKAQRARCIQAVADGRLPLAEHLALCAAVLAQPGLPMVVRITPFSRPEGLDASQADLAELAYQVLDDTLVMVAHAAFAEADGSLRGSPAGQRAAQAERGWPHRPCPTLLGGLAGQAMPACRPAARPPPQLIW